MRSFESSDQWGLTMQSLSRERSVANSRSINTNLGDSITLVQRKRRQFNPAQAIDAQSLNQVFPQIDRLWSV